MGGGRGLTASPRAVRGVVAGFAPDVSGHIVVRPRAAGPKQEPPLPVTVELPRDRPSDAALAQAIASRLRDVLVFRAHVDLVPWGTLQRSDYKSKLVQYEETG